MYVVRHKRILLKLSGESLSGEGGFGVDPDVLSRIADEIASVCRMGVQVGVVVGGGNMFRGSNLVSLGMDRADADYVGMLATVMNAIILREVLKQKKVSARSMSALQIETVIELYVRNKAITYLEDGLVVIFAAGTGNPFFTTDTAASLRGTEIGASIVLKATKVDGVYDKDPNIYKDAVRYDSVSVDVALAKELRVMDATALALCRDQNLPIIVFDIFRHGSLSRIVCGEPEGTLVYC
ncbi:MULTISPECIES: UMP kinase [Candidatus Ichthyocystis]|uniref:Uridylate kinase n=1 Tax=Candidatus Ichthyocystis hellenicum TaxID=1561003 RepID=A0A0S4M041_9BURK|nr:MULTISPECIES: UMP kinase [Ichthyocystis]CUT16977.1 Uridylate kinase [Candidatus Ichthyocystis hellenicum]